MGLSPKIKIRWAASNPYSYVVELSFPCWPRVFLASAHINKLMIIAKREKPHIQNTQQTNRRVR